MVVNRKPTGRAVSMAAGLGIGAGFALIWSILGAMITAKILDTEMMPESAIGYSAAIILATASFGAAMIAYGKIQRLRTVVCLVSGGIYFLMLLCVTALMFGGQYAGVGVTALMILAGSGAAAVLGLSKRGGQGHRSYKKIKV